MCIRSTINDKLNRKNKKLYIHIFDNLINSTSFQLLLPPYRQQTRKLTSSLALNPKPNLVSQNIN
jgi:hypothetical protein